jgi:deoxyribodipyrimidine photo-lyase
MNKVNVFWFRRDLRLQDNHGLYQALSSDLPVLPIFIFDKNILEDLKDKDDARVTFIHNVLSKMHEELKAKGSGISFFYNDPKTAFEKLSEQYEIESVFSNHDYEPYALERDREIEKFLKVRELASKPLKIK